jgi:hypothetical protein
MSDEDWPSYIRLRSVCRKGIGGFEFIVIRCGDVTERRAFPSHLHWELLRDGLPERVTIGHHGCVAWLVTMKGATR